MLRYRKLDENGDYSFGQGKVDYYIDVPEAVGQSVLTKLRLFYPEWQLDITDGTRWKTEVLGAGKSDEQILIEVRRRIREVPNVKELLSLELNRNRESRTVHITANILTDFGETVVNEDMLSMNPFVTEH